VPTVLGKDGHVVFKGLQTSTTRVPAKLPKSSKTTGAPTVLGKDGHGVFKGSKTTTTRAPAKLPKSPKTTRAPTVLGKDGHGVFNGSQTSTTRVPAKVPQSSKTTGAPTVLGTDGHGVFKGSKTTTTRAPAKLPQSPNTTRAPTVSGQEGNGFSKVAQRTTTTAARESASQDMRGDRVEEAVGKVNVVYATTTEDVVGLMHSMISLSRTFARPAALRIHVIVPAANKSRALSTIGCFMNEFEDKTLAPRVKLHAFKPPTVPTHHQTQRRLESIGGINFAKLYLPDYLPNQSRALWLDTDTIVRKDLSSFYARRMTSIIAVATPISSMSNTSAHFKWTDRKYPGNASWGSFNSGVMLVDLARWRAAHVNQSLEAWGARLTRDKVGYGDQLLLNLEFHFNRNFDAVHRGFNENNLGCKSSRTWPSPAETSILHFSGTFKPWKARCKDWCAAEFYSFAPGKRCLTSPVAPREKNATSAAGEKVLATTNSSQTRTTWTSTTSCC